MSETEKTKGDVIFREDAIKAMLNGYCSCVNDCVDEIKKLPPADRPVYFVKCEMLLSREDFEKMRTDMVRQNENIVLLPPGLEVADRPGGEWIPCSERLPDVGKDVMLQFRDNQCVGNRYSDNGEDGWLINSGGNWETPILGGDEKPIAWKPLPEPYKGGE